MSLNNCVCYNSYFKYVTQKFTCIPFYNTTELHMLLILNNSKNRWDNKSNSSICLSGLKKELDLRSGSHAIDIS